MRREPHAVGVAGEYLVDVEQQVERFIEVDLVPSEQTYAAGTANPFQGGLDDSGVDGVRAQALQPEQHGAIRTVPASGQCEGAV
jgi:hypothetical protein